VNERLVLFQEGLDFMELHITVSITVTFREAKRFLYCSSDLVVVANTKYI
jgi:hypothetical protein